MRLGLAIKAFFRALMDRSFAERVAGLLRGEEGQPDATGQSAPAAEQATEAPSRPAAVQAPAAARRSEALTLLALLQREARLVDFAKESLDGYPDAQVGAAVRDIHRNLQATLERTFGPRPLTSEAEDEAISVPAGYSPMRITLAGEVSGTPPYEGKVCHRGWLATRCELPAWSGRDEDADVIAPAEVEVR